MGCRLLRDRAKLCYERKLPRHKMDTAKVGERRRSGGVLGKEERRDESCVQYRWYEYGT